MLVHGWPTLIRTETDCLRFRNSAAGARLPAGLNDVAPSRAFGVSGYTPGPRSMPVPFGPTFWGMIAPTLLLNSADFRHFQRLLAGKRRVFTHQAAH